jgi:hypothetical protein
MSKLSNQVNANNDYYQTVIKSPASIQEFKGAPEIERFFEQGSMRGRTFVFASPHWGSYLKSFVLIGNSFPAATHFVALRGREWNDQEQTLWQEINSHSKSTIEIYRVLEKKGFARVLRTMRSGAHLFLLYDLYDEYGDVKLLKIFDNELCVTFRWIDLVRIVGAVVVFVHPASVDRTTIKFSAILDSRGHTKSSFERSCLRECSNSLEQLLLEEPEYWFMWQHLEKYGLKS